MFGMKTTGLKRMIEMKISVHKRKEKTMGKQHWKPGNMLNPVPAVMVSVTDKEGKSNIITVAWTGILNTNPATCYISVRPERYSHDIIKKNVYRRKVKRLKYN